MPFPLVKMLFPFSQLPYHQSAKYLFLFLKSQISLLQELSQMPHFIPEGASPLLPGKSVFTVTLIRYGNLLVICLSPLSTVNYSSIPGNLELLNKCLWCEYTYYSLLPFVFFVFFLHTLQGPARVSPPLCSFPGFTSLVELIMPSAFPWHFVCDFITTLAKLPHISLSVYLGLPHCTTPGNTIYIKSSNAEMAPVFAH